jgi:NADH dehydrogenase
MTAEKQRARCAIAIAPRARDKLTERIVPRGYHLFAMAGNRMRVLTDWTLNATAPTDATSFGMITAESVPLDVENPRP